MTTPIKLINQHSYEEIETLNTWQFFLYNNRGRKLLQHSVHKNCYTQGKVNFWQKVSVLYDTIQAEKAAKAKVAQLTQDRRKEARAVKVAALEADLESLFSEIDAEQYALHTSLALQSNTDFLGKIERYILPV